MEKGNNTAAFESSWQSVPQVVKQPPRENVFLIKIVLIASFLITKWYKQLKSPETDEWVDTK